MPILSSLIRDESTKITQLTGGVTKYTKIDAPNTTARVFDGILSLGISEIFSHTSETHYYYYGDKYLGKNLNEAAETANRMAQQLCDGENFEEAEGLFNAAYYTCESGYQNEQNFKNSKETMAIATQAKHLETNGKLSEAMAKFHEAYDLSSVSEVYTTMRQCRNAAERAAEQKALEEAEQKAREEAERKAREEAQRKAREEAERKAREEAERKSREEAEKKAQKQTERKAREDAERLAAESKAREEAEKISLEKQAAANLLTGKNSDNKEDVSSRISKSATRWKQLAEKYTTDHSATKIVSRWQQIAEALRINEQGLKLFSEGKLKEAVAEIESALEKCIY
ncbi:unnamed protein product [Rotaria sp. Silwood2]|nr:unnamed protein product [Rotaria sp. Silwood2]